MWTTLLVVYVLGLILFAYVGGRVGLEHDEVAVVFLWPFLLVLLGPILFVRWLVELGQKHGGY